MTKTVNLYVSNVGATGGNAILSWTSTTKGSIRAIGFAFAGTQGGATSHHQIELGTQAIFQGNTNDSPGTLLQERIAFNGSGAGVPQAFSKVHVGFNFPLNVGDRLYVNLASTAAPTQALYCFTLYIEV